MSQDPVRHILESDFHPIWLRADKYLIDQLCAGFNSWLEHQPRMEGVAITEENLRARLLVEYLGFWIKEKLEQMESLRALFTEFSQRHSHAATEREQVSHILEFARQLGASSREVAADRRAFSRWFGYDAMAERYDRRHRLAERELMVVLGRLGVCAAHYLGTFAVPEQSILSWRQLQLEKLLRPLLAYEGDPRVRIAAFECLAASLSSLPHAQQERAVTDTTLRYIYRSSLERRQEVWIQCAALTLLQTLSTESLIAALRHRLENPAEGDDLFVRRCAMRLLGQQLADSPELQDLLHKTREDPNPAVRQLIVSCLTHADTQTTRTLLKKLVEEDPEPTVRAAALLGLPALIQRGQWFELVLSQLQASLAAEQHSYVLRVGLKVMGDIHRQLIEARQVEQATRWYSELAPHMARLHQGAPDLAVRRWTAEVREQMWLLRNPIARQLSEELAGQLAEIPPREAARIKRNLLKVADRDTLGRTLSCLAQKDFDLELERDLSGSRLRRGSRLGFRAWRAWHEFLRPSTDKRQGFAHTTGRIYQGRLHAPSAVMGELAETKVPGEPLFLAEEGGRRPYLPLVDEVISALDAGLLRGKSLWLYSAEGITEISPPASLLRRLVARTVLTLRFEQFARKRNWQEGERAAPTAYAQALDRLGITMAFFPHLDEVADNGAEDEPESSEPSWDADPAVQRFFPAVVPVPFVLGDVFETLQDYFFSVYQNNIKQLLLFLGAALIGMFGRHIYLYTRIKSARRAIPLVLGGWGTRGKSGTERLKAALINARGYSVLSKTTGCEAMFMHSHPNGRLREMMLFRPYDKATIWEQANLVRLGQRLGADVFLWECMGLTPSYVGILQQQWMQDDFATITNTYPDHEDLQGPAGYNIPEVMTNFIPANSVLLTTEEQMLPILRASARAKQTRLRTVGWLESGLLPPDILQRFPYEEHPDNIALVAELADELGLEEDFALKEMADRVVADLGVLKTSPLARVDGRRLEFINGMSANERFGAMGNWQRTGFADHDPYVDPDTWLATVVNNRADREPRSQVFASILVEDIDADHHFLIGTNLDGLRGYIRDAWHDYMDKVSLYGDEGDSESDPLAMLEKMARRFRVPYAQEHVKGRLQAMLQAFAAESLGDNPDGLWDQPEVLREKLEAAGSAGLAEELMQFHQRNLDGLQQFAELRASIEAEAAEPKALESQFKEQLWGWFWNKFTIIEDPHSTGEQVVKVIVKGTPPGLKGRVMGMQNIKGTGLDFVYRWQGWEICHQHCIQLDSRNAAEAGEGLRNLSAFQDFGQLSEETVREVVERVSHKKIAQNELFQAELRVILANLDNAMNAARQKMGAGRSVGMFARVLDAVEAFLDSGDAVRRRKLANRIYRDLEHERISYERASIELKALNKRQKEGWLKQRAYALVAGAGKGKGAADGGLQNN